MTGDIKESERLNNLIAGNRCRWVWFAASTESRGGREKHGGIGGDAERRTRPSLRAREAPIRRRQVSTLDKLQQARPPADEVRIACKQASYIDQLPPSCTRGGDDNAAVSCLPRIAFALRIPLFGLPSSLHPLSTHVTLHRN